MSTQKREILRIPQNAYGADVSSYVPGWPGLELLVLDDHTHRRATALAHAWEAINTWTVEPEYAARRLAALRALVS